MISVHLNNPKHAYNVAAVLRTCAILGAQRLGWDGKRVPHPDDWEGSRMPREERMRLYRTVKMVHCADPSWALLPGTPVCVELSETAERLPDFVHPDDACYVFGPEDGGVCRYHREGSYRFVMIPGAPGSVNAPLNLATAVALVLYDRLTKESRVCA